MKEAWARFDQLVLDVTKINLREDLMMSVNYNDQECVAALNYCLDLEKWKNLPSTVRDRILDLMRAKRIQGVCFMSAVGFGLRVYRDETAFKINEDNDEAQIDQLEGSDGKIDLDGYWVRCPKELFENKKATKIYVVANSQGRSYYNGEESDNNPWMGRINCKKFTNREEAEEVAKRLNGVVLEND